MESKTMERAHSRISRQRAFSLIESVVTVALVGIIVIGVVPLFGRAILNNVYGADASQLTAFTRTGLESLLQRTANSNTFVDDATGSDDTSVEEQFRSAQTVLRYNPNYFDMGERRSYGTDKEIGDERWIADPEDAEGVLVWRAYLEKREYGYADVHIGTVSVEGGALAQTGHPKLFDVPLDILDDSGDRIAGFAGGDISELRMIVESLKGSDYRNTSETGDGSGLNRVAMTATGIHQRVRVSTLHVF
jgi:prepilin-type N-terminal cleavage/methylation domain-containing protein